MNEENNKGDNSTKAHLTRGTACGKMKIPEKKGENDMPNWVYNKVHFQDKEDYDKVKELLSNGKPDTFDFNQLIPMPSELEESQASDGMGDVLMASGVSSFADINEIYEKVMELADDMGIDEEITDKVISDSLPILQLFAYAQSEIYRFTLKLQKSRPSPKEPEVRKETLELLLKHGYTSWYDWSLDFWGTKWNACEVRWIEDEMAVYFETAWSPPGPVIDRLAERFGLSFFYEYSEEQFSEYAGEFLYEEGELVKANQPESGSFELFQIASRMMDEEQDYYRYDKQSMKVVYSPDNYDYDEEEYKEKSEAFYNIPYVDCSPEWLEGLRGY